MISTLGVQPNQMNEALPIQVQKEEKENQIKHN